MDGVSQQDYVIGVDSSTTATKAVVWDRKGNTVAEGRATFPLAMPRPGWHEQDAEDWWRSTRDALREVVSKVDPKRIRAIGLTHQRESFVCLGEDDRPLRAAMLWLDSRAGEEVEKYGSERIHEITGKPPSTTPALYKIHWIRDNEPDVFERTARITDVHGFLVHRLTGHRRTSWASADPMGLLDMRSFDWSDEVLKGVGISRDQLPELCPPGEIVGELTDEVAEEIGLPAGLPVVGGAGDGQAAGLGANVTEPGRAYLNLGTAMVSGTYSEDYAWDRAFRTLAGPVPHTYTLETLVRGGTYTISWFVENFGGINAEDLGLDLTDEEVMEAAALQVPPGSEGLLLLPYWNTASTPYWDSQASGVMFGFRGRHKKAHVYRAVMEGLAFEQRLGTGGLEEGTGQKVERFMAMGGGSRSRLFCRIVADITKRPVTVCREVETTCLGAAMLAAAATGLYDDIREAASGMSGEGATFEPDQKTAGFYDRVYTDVYGKLYPSLSPLFPAMEKALKLQDE